LKAHLKKKKKKSRDEASLAVNYSHKHADLSLKITKKELNPLLLTPSLAFHYEDFSAGFEAEYEIDTKEDDKKDKKEAKDIFRDFNFGASFKTDNLTIVGTVVNKLSDANIGIIHKINKNTSLGFEFTHKLSKKMLNLLKYKSDALQFLMINQMLKQNSWALDNYQLLIKLK